jgi:RNA polymerase sigma-70 factor (ECF subfamily)
MANLQRDLVKRAADGDQEAFEALVRLSAGRLFAIAYRVLRDHGHAEDALQQALATIWNDLPKLRDPDRFEAWSYRLIVRASVAQARHERRGEPVVHLLPNDADTLAPQGPDDFDRVADRDQLERGFRRLTPDQRAVLVLEYYAGLSLAEIADVLGIPVGTAGSRVHNASRALRAALDADDRTESLKERTA